MPERRGVWLAVLLLGLALPWAAWADATLEVCYNYGCMAQAEVTFSEAQLHDLRGWLLMADGPAAELGILAQVLGQMYRWAGAQSPISVDRPGDFLDDGVYGAMDCIDHAETTTRFLHLLEDRGWLHFHRVAPIRRRTRWVVAQHFSAVVQQRQAEGEGPEFVMDTWFGEHGDPAVVLPLEDWLDGEGPNVS